MPFTRPTDNSSVWYDMSFLFPPIESYEVCYRRFWAKNYTFSISKSKWCSRKWDFLIHVFCLSRCLASNGPFLESVGLLILASTRVNWSRNLARIVSIYCTLGKWMAWSFSCILILLLWNFLLSLIDLQIKTLLIGIWLTGFPLRVGLLMLSSTRVKCTRNLAGIVSI